MTAAAELGQDMRMLTGQSQAHLANLEGAIWLHAAVIEPVRRLQTSAAAAGITLAVASGYRDFARQCLIWNDKVAGKRPVYDADGTSPLDIAQLSPRELLFAILRWSALPGTSRHHWGTDMDVWDSAAVPPDYRLQLTPDEYGDGGPFARLARWLEQTAVAELGFYRPYLKDRGGVSPEPWHLSHRPIADHCAGHFDLDQYAALLRSSDIALKGEILANLDEIYRRFVRCP